MTIILQHKISRAVNEHRDVISISTTNTDIAVALHFAGVSAIGTIDDASIKYIDAEDWQGGISIIHYNQSAWHSVITP